ncbi:MAG: hypothetical protein M1816_007434 [Peltula sp. TS41687]|nr:MAG: hypothetical protein M1816_007434 [Peltula sp. TS41687]
MRLLLTGLSILAGTCAMTTTRTFPAEHGIEKRGEPPLPSNGHDKPGNVHSRKLVGRAANPAHYEILKGWRPAASLHFSDCYFRKCIPYMRFEKYVNDIQWRGTPDYTEFCHRVCSRRHNQNSRLMPGGDFEEDSLDLPFEKSLDRCLGRCPKWYLDPADFRDSKPDLDAKCRKICEGRYPRAARNRQSNLDDEKSNEKGADTEFRFGGGGSWWSDKSDKALRWVGGIVRGADGGGGVEGHNDFRSTVIPLPRAPVGGIHVIP